MILVEKRKLLLKQFYNFFIVSGIGWCIDISLYTSLVYIGFDVFISNMTSALLAVSYVYFVSTKNIFLNQTNNYKYRYFIYILYQVLSILFFTLLIKYIINISQDFFTNIALLDIAVFVKIFVTPINLITNFLFMKLFLEIIKTRKNNNGDR